MNATGNVTMTANETGVVRGNSNNVGVGGMAGIGAGGGAAVLFFVLLFGAWSQMVSGRHYCCHVRVQRPNCRYVCRLACKQGSRVRRCANACSPAHERVSGG